MYEDWSPLQCFYHFLEDCPSLRTLILEVSLLVSWCWLLLPKMNVSSCHHHSSRRSHHHHQYYYLQLSFSQSWSNKWIFISMATFFLFRKIWTTRITSWVESQHQRFNTGLESHYLSVLGRFSIMRDLIFGLEHL